jgi:hypothetical protein
LDQAAALLWLAGRRPGGDLRVISGSLRSPDGEPVVYGLTFVGRCSFTPFYETVEQVNADIANGYSYHLGDVAAHVTDRAAAFRLSGRAVFCSDIDIEDWAGNPLDEAPEGPESPAMALLDWPTMWRQESSYVTRRWDRVNASMFVYGADGERLTAEPSRLEADAHRSRVLEALARAGQVVAGPVDELRALTAAAITERAELSPWLTHLTRAVSAVDKAATRWPEPPPFADDSTFEDAIAGLERAVVLREARGENRQRAGERAGREAAAGQGRFHESAYRAR